MTYDVVMEFTVTIGEKNESKANRIAQYIAREIEKLDYDIKVYHVEVEED